MIKIRLRKSTIGYSRRQRRTIKALGLGKLNSSTVKPDNVQIRGMIRQVGHLIEVEHGEENMPGGKQSEAE